MPFSATLTRRVKYVLAALFFFGVCTAQAQDPELAVIYGTELSSFYKTKKIKEIYIESDRYSSGKLVHPRFLSSYVLLDSEGRVVRSEYANSAHQLNSRRDYAYDAKGMKTLTTIYEVAGREDAGKRSSIRWRPSSQHRQDAFGQKPAGRFRWEVAEEKKDTKGKWVQQTVERAWIKNDTTYYETRDAADSSAISKDLSRHYLSGVDQSIHRSDHLSYSPKGLHKPNYYYDKRVDGKLLESGVMSFDMEVGYYLQQHPEDNRLLFTKFGFYPLYDKIARSSFGRPVASTTYTYDAQGRLIEEQGYNKVLYQRDKQGRVVSLRTGGTYANYYYNDQGLLEGMVQLSVHGEPSETLFYRYTFYE
jgi:hypothetical protein